LLIILFFGYAIFYSLDYYSYDGNIYFFDVLVYTIIHPVFVFYSSAYTIARFKVKSILETLLSISRLILSIFLFFGVKYLYRIYFISYFKFPPYKVPFNLTEYIIDGITWYFHFTLWAIGYFFLKKSIRNEKEARVKEKEYHELQQQKLIAECNFLRTQINPHFLYNTLNFFISKTAAHDENISDGLTKLASIMRYSLTQANSHGQVLLQDEVANMENFITLQQLRYGNTLNMEYTKMGNITTQYILPHLLITLVENAFKHGNTRSTTQPLVISLVVQNNELQFTVTNAIDKVTLEQSGTNVGLQNFKDRLLIAYNTTCTYTIEASNGIYKAYLQVPLLHTIRRVSETLYGFVIKERLCLDNKKHNKFIYERYYP
jgi:two-component system, LytTR family, sensor kinase